jgi:putative peptide zinc metalloprotease protein
MVDSVQPTVAQAEVVPVAGLAEPPIIPAGKSDAAGSPASPAVTRGDAGRGGNDSAADAGGHSGPPKYSEFLADAVIQSRGDLDISRQVFAGKPQYVLRDAVSFQSRSLSARDYRIFASIDGVRTCQVVFDDLVNSGVLRADEEDGYYGFLVSLHQRGLLNLPIANGKALYERHRTRQRRARRGWAMKLLCWKVSFGNPDAWLDRVTGPLKFLIGKTTLVVWAIAVLVALRMVIQRWDQFATPLASVLAGQSIATVMVILVLLKAWHELGHAVATKGWGGEVPDYGVLLILGTPCAYVDASSAWMMPSRLRRIVISAAGIYFESMVAIVGVFIWTTAEDPWLRSIAHHTIFLSTLTTLLFNANPLMKFDGYFILSDWLDVPNLKSRADESFRWVVKTCLLGSDVAMPAGSLAANFGLATFGAAAGIYRLMIISGILALLTWQLPFGGLCLAAIYLIMTAIKSIATVVRYVWKHPEVARNRRQAWLVTIGAVILLAIGSCWPIPQDMSTMGVTEFATEILVRSRGDGTIRRVAVREGDSVAEGQVLVDLDSPALIAAVTRAESEVAAKRLQFTRASIEQSEETEPLRNQWLTSQLELQRLRKQVDGLTVRATAAGVITDWNEGADVGKSIVDGEVLANLGSGGSVVRTLLGQRQREIIQPVRGERVWVLLPWDLGQRHPARVIRVKQTETEFIRDSALTSLAGGDIEVDPSDMTPLNDVYVVEAELINPPRSMIRRGLRAKIVFTDRSQSVARWAWHRWLDFYRRYQQAS